MCGGGNEEERPIRYLVVVDGEHYPPVVEAALVDVVAAGHEVAAAILVGGREKLPADGVEAYGDVQVRTGESARDVLDEAILELEPDAVLDYSDEPVLDYRRRHQLAAVALVRGVPYEGADFRFMPPPRPRFCEHPSIAVIGTGKRTGKTAVAGFSARALVQAGHKPVIVAMGRGGPPEPQVLRGDEVELTPADLLEIAASGKHAASDYVEDALLGRVPTVGCRRCGGGLAGGVDVSNVADGVRIANDLPGDMILLEGSGSAIPPIHADVTGLIVPAAIPLEYLTGYMGPYRLLLSDFAVVTMCEEPFGSPSQISAITSEIQTAFRSGRGKGVPQEEIRVVRTVFRPSPTRPVEGKKAFVATTAPRDAAEGITTHLEEEHGCEVVGISHSLSDRGRLEKEIANIADIADVLLVEIKAAGIDVATKKATDEGLEIVYMDNVPQSIDDEEVASLVQWAGDLARERFESR